MSRTATLRVTDAGMLEVDVDRLLEELDDGSVARLLARSAAFRTELVARIVEHLRDGWTDDGDCWGNSDAERLRMLLVPHLPEAVAHLVRQLVDERDSAKVRADRWLRACHDLSCQWDAMDAARKRKAIDIDYRVARTMTRAEAQALVARLIAEDGPPATDGSAGAGELAPVRESPGTHP